MADLSGVYDAVARRARADAALCAHRERRARAKAEIRFGCACRDETGRAAWHIPGADCGAAADLEPVLEMLGLLPAVPHRRTATPRVRNPTGAGRWPHVPKGRSGG